MKQSTEELATDLIQTDVNVQLVHVLAQLFVRFVGAVDPFWIWMNVPDELCEIYHSAQQVAQPVQVLDHDEEALFRLFDRGRGRDLTESDDAVDENFGAESRARCEERKVGRVSEEGLVEETGGGRGRRGGSVREGRSVERLVEDIVEGSGRRERRGWSSRGALGYSEASGEGTATS
jgi:hypothetical protein